MTTTDQEANQRHLYLRNYYNLILKLFLVATILIQTIGKSQEIPKIIYICHLDNVKI